MKTAEILSTQQFVSEHHVVPELLRELVIDIVQQELAKRRDNTRTAIPINRSAQSTSDISKLSAREKEVLVLIASGYSRNEISASLGVTYNTASTHISNIYTKLSISTIAEATQLALRSGLLQ